MHAIYLDNHRQQHDTQRMLESVRTAPVICIRDIRRTRKPVRAPPSAVAHIRRFDVVTSPRLSALSSARSAMIRRFVTVRFTGPLSRDCRNASRPWPPCLRRPSHPFCTPGAASPVGPEPRDRRESRRGPGGPTDRGPGDLSDVPSRPDANRLGPAQSSGCCLRLSGPLSER